MLNHHEHANLIWQIADLLRGPYRPPQYERVMLPMTVLRRFDCMLAPAKAKVLAEHAKRKGGKIEGDALDPYCEHLLIRHTATQHVVGTYRILTFDQAQRAGGFYSAREFDLRRLAGLSARTIEVGRAYVDPEHRNGVVLSLLWGGLFEFMRSVRCEYVIGCGSVSVADDGRLSAAICNRLRRQHMGPSEWRVIPFRPFPLDPTVSDAGVALPPLLKGYLRLGAVVCGDPAWDPDFRTADFLLLLPVATINARHADFLRRRVVRRIYA